MKITLSIEGLDNNDIHDVREALKGTYLHYSMKGNGDAHIKRLDISDMRDIDTNELVDVIKSLRATTWKAEGVEK